jgi:transcriptional regulator with XRE-family HTH domain
MKFTLRAIRVNNGYTLKEASEKLGISTVTLRSYEYYRTVPNINMVNKILELYKVNIDDISFVPKNNKPEQK